MVSIPQWFDDNQKTIVEAALSSMPNIVFKSTQGTLFRTNDFPTSARDAIFRSFGEYPDCLGAIRVYSYSFVKERGQKNYEHFVVGVSKDATSWVPLTANAHWPPAGPLAALVDKSTKLPTFSDLVERFGVKTFFAVSLVTVIAIASLISNPSDWFGWLFASFGGFILLYSFPYLAISGYIKRTRVLAALAQINKLTPMQPQPSIA